MMLSVQSKFTSNFWFEPTLIFPSSPLVCLRNFILLLIHVVYSLQFTWCCWRERRSEFRLKQNDFIAENKFPQEEFEGRFIDFEWREAFGGLLDFAFTQLERWRKSQRRVSREKIKFRQDNNKLSLRLQKRSRPFKALSFKLKIFPKRWKKPEQ